MKSKLMKSISVVLLAFFSWSTISVYAIDKTETLGEDILNATSVQEIDNLLNDYHNISSQPIITTNTSGISPLSFPTDWMLLSSYSDGGTAYLNNYTGSKVLGYDLYKKIVFLNSENVNVLLKAMTNASILNFLKDYVAGAITGAIAAKIAATLGLATIKANFLVGLPVAFLYYAINTGRLKDLQNAMTAAGGYKVRYDMYYIVQILPYSLTYHTDFSPWIGNKIYVPRYYSEVGFKPGVIDMK